MRPRPDNDNIRPVCTFLLVTMDNRNEWRIFYATALEGPQAYTFWNASIYIDPDLIINDLARKLVAEYVKSHQAFSVEIFKASIYILPSCP